MQLINDNNNNMDLGEKQSHDRLIDGQDIRFKTEITNDQRGVISSIETSIDHFGKKNINLYVADKFVKSYIDMGASVDRKSRLEVVKALVAKNEFLERQLIMEKQQQQIR
jgi:hypothetical protein